MSAYAIVTIQLEDPKTFARYREIAGPALGKHKGKPMAVSSESQVIEGDGAAPDVTVILEFPDRDHALAWISDKELDEVHATRRASGRSQIILM